MLLDRPKQLRDLLLLAMVLVVALFTFLDSARRSPYHTDEGLNIGTGRYFGYLFLERNISRSEWRDNYWTHNHPMLMRYFMGGSLWLRGHNLEEMPPASMEGMNQLKLLFNRIEPEEMQKIQEEPALFDARAPMALLAAAAVGVLYLLGRELGGVLAGFVASALAIASPSSRELLVRATPDAPLAFFFLLSLLLSIMALHRARGAGLSSGWAIAVGVAMGLALAAKLTAVLSVATAVAWALAASFTSARWAPGGKLRERLRRARTEASGWLLAVALASSVFVLSNPHLYPNPAIHTAHLMQLRAGEGRSALFSERAFTGVRDRAQYVVGGSLVGQTWAGSHGVPVEALLALTGFGWLASRAWRKLRGRRVLSSEALIVGACTLHFIAITALIVVPVPRYLLPTFLLGTLLSGLGASFVLARVAPVWPALGRPGVLAKRGPSVSL